MWPDVDWWKRPLLLLWIIRNFMAEVWLIEVNRCYQLLVRLVIIGKRREWGGRSKRRRRRRRRGRRSEKQLDICDSWYPKAEPRETAVDALWPTSNIDSVLPPHLEQLLFKNKRKERERGDVHKQEPLRKDFEIDAKREKERERGNSVIYWVGN